MCQIIVEGDSAFDLVQKITTNDVEKLIDGDIQYSCMLNEKGGIIDDLLVYRISNNKYMLVVNASNAQKDFQWICSANSYNLSISDVTSKRGLLAIQGPKALQLLQNLTSVSLDSIPYYKFKIGRLADCEDVIISRTGYTGSGGFEIYMKQEDSEKIWRKIFSIKQDVEPIGLAARDTLRLEMGYCLYGNDITEETTPVEAGLSWIVKTDTDFIGKSCIVRQIDNGVTQKLVGFILQERGVPRQGYEILNVNNQIIGRVTSGTISPSLNQPLGMGYVITQEASIGNNILIKIRNKTLKAIIVKRPFYEK
tara:strand:- start:4 stop:930 length:927 start_codon:yes stop_codon:yes gene_type:complete